MPPTDPGDGAIEPDGGDPTLEPDGGDPALEPDSSAPTLETDGGVAALDADDGTAHEGRGTLAESASRRGSFPDPALALSIARMEVRRSYRRLRDHDLWLLVLVVLLLPTALFVWVAFRLARDAGQTLAAAGPDAATAGAVDAIPALLGATWLLHLGFFVVSGVGDYGDLDEAPGMLTVRPAKDFAGGLLAANVCYYVVYLAIGVGAGYAGLAVGTGSALPPIGGFAAAAVLLLTAAAVGYPAGLALKGALRRSSAPEWLKPVLGGVVGLAYFYVMFTGTWTTVLDALEPALETPPLGWLGDLALVTTPGAGASVAGALGALAATAVVLPIGTLATVRAAEYAWYGDGAGTIGGTEDADDVEDGQAAGEERQAAGEEPAGVVARAVDGSLDAVTRRDATRGVAEVVLLRAYRAPMQLLYATFPLLLALPMVEGLLASGSLPWYAPWLAVLFGAWIAGETFALNLLGNQGATLPVLLTSRADGRAVVHGHVAAVALPLAPLTAAAAVGTGVLAGRALPELVVLGAAGVAAVLAGAVLASGIGATFPRFEALTVGSSHEVAVPSKRALGAFSLCISLGTTGVVLAADETARRIGGLAIGWLLSIDPVAPGDLRVVGWLLVALVAVAVPVSYVVAVRRIDDFQLG